MKLIKIKPSKIKIPEVRVTSVMTEEKQELLKDFLAKSGILAPVVVQEIEGEIWLVDGKHRIDELIAAGDYLLDAAVLEGDMVDLLTRNLFLDHVRGDHKVGDMIRVLRSLSEDYGLDVVRIEEKTGLSRSYIEKILKISLASQAVHEALDLGMIGVGHAFEIARLPATAQQEELLAKQQVFRFPVKELRSFIDQVLKEMEGLANEEPQPGPPETLEPRKYQCEGCKQETDPRYLKPVLVCPDCFGTVWRLGKLEPAAALKVAEE